MHAAVRCVPHFVVRSTTVLLATLLLCSLCEAQTFPTRPLRLLTPYGPGGSYDALARMVAHKLGEQLGQQVLVDNRPGAAGRIGMELAIKMAPDGHNLIVIGNSQTIVPSVYTKVPYDLDKDIIPVSLVATITNALVIHPGVSANTLTEFVQLAKAKPGTFKYSSGGTGGVTHLMGALLGNLTGIEMLHVPYKSGATAMNAAVAGEVDMTVLNVLNSAPQIRSGKLKGLGVTGRERSSFLPDLPTLDEAGAKGYEVVEFHALAVPAGTAKPLVDRLHQEIVRAVSASDMKEQFAKFAAVPATLSPEQTRTFILAEQEKYARIVKAVGIKPE